MSGVLLAIATFLASSADVLFALFHPVTLGVILFLAGAQLALGSCDLSKDKGERFVTLVAAALGLWNVGLAFVVGVAVYALQKRELVRL